MKSKTAVKVNIAIMHAFVGMRKFFMENATVFQRLDKVELKQLETDKKVDFIIKALEDKSIWNNFIFICFPFVSLPIL